MEFGRAVVNGHGPVVTIFVCHGEFYRELNFFAFRRVVARFSAKKVCFVHVVWFRRVTVLDANLAKPAIFSIACTLSLLHTSIQILSLIMNYWLGRKEHLRVKPFGICADTFKQVSYFVDHVKLDEFIYYNNDNL